MGSFEEGGRAGPLHEGIITTRPIASVSFASGTVGILYTAWVPCFEELLVGTLYADRCPEGIDNL